MKIIELTGLPGSGKSHICDEAKYLEPADFELKVISKEGNFCKLFVILNNMVRKEVIKSIFILLKIVLEMNRSASDRFKFIFNGLYKICNQFRFHKTIDCRIVVIVDEGLAHLFQNIVEDGPLNVYQFHKVVRILNLMPSSDAIWVVDTPIDVVADRLVNRGHKRLDGNIDTETFLRNSRLSLLMLCHIKNDAISHCDGTKKCSLEELIGEFLD